MAAAPKRRADVEAAIDVAPAAPEKRAGVDERELGTAALAACGEPARLACCALRLVPLYRRLQTTVAGTA